MNLPEILDRWLAAMGWFWIILGGYTFISRFMKHFFPRVPYDLYCSGIFIAALLPLAFFLLRARWSEWKKLWRMWLHKSLRLTCAFGLVPMIPYLIWYLYHPLLAQWKLLVYEDRIEEWVFIFCGAVLFIGRRFITTRLLLGPPAAIDP